MILACARLGSAHMWTYRRQLWPFYLANLCFGLMIMLPFGFLLDAFVGNSLMRERLGTGMDYDFLFEFLLNNGDGLASVRGVLLAAPLLYWIAALFLAGGALTVFAQKRYTPALFWGGAAGCYGTFLRLALLSIPLLAALYCIRYLENAIQWLIFGTDPYEYVIYWGAWIRMGLGYLGLVLFGLVFDYARIQVVLAGERRARHVLWGGLRFAARNPLKTLSLALLFFCVGWVVLFIYYGIASALTPAHWLVVVILLIVQQLYILFRMALRLATYAGQMEMYRRLAA